MELEIADVKNRFTLGTIWERQYTYGTRIKHVLPLHAWQKASPVRAGPTTTPVAVSGFSSETGSAHSSKHYADAVNRRAR